MKRRPTREQKGNVRSEAIPQVEASKCAHSKHSAHGAAMLTPESIRRKPAPSPVTPAFVDDERPLEELLHQDACD